MTPRPDEVADVARTIQAAVAPVFLLAGIGAFMNVMAGRLARVVDRGRVVEERYHRAAAPDRAPYLDELRLLDRRIKLASNAILLSVASGLAVCMLVAMMFIGEMSGLEIGTVVSLLFVLALGLLAAALTMFLVETRIAVTSLRIDEELLKADRLS